MFDVKALRDDPAAFDAAWARRGLPPQTPAILDADKALREAKTTFEATQSRRNEASKQIGAAKAKKDEARAAELMAEVEALKADLPRLSEAEKTAETALRDLLAGLPNLPAADVPDGEDESGNQLVRERGRPKLSSWPQRGVGPGPSLDDAPASLGPGSAAPSGMTGEGWVKDHVALGEALGQMDFEAAARMSGARFVVLRKDLARLERALGQFMLDLQTREHGYEEVSPPILVRGRALFGTGQLPKFVDDLFVTAETVPLIDGSHRKILIGDEGSRYLIPTAEVSLTNLVREQIVDEVELPLRLTALTPCFRSEAGASGRDTRGMIRQHQFTKCELVSITTPEQSGAEHDRMVECAETVLKRLELPFRTMLLCTGDMGFTAKKTYDLEVWLPSQATWREISSCSNCGDFQARRMDARIRKAGEKGTRFPHTLNGSGLAVGRTLVAVMENFQDEGGRIAIPPALQPYMGGQTHIGGAT